MPTITVDQMALAIQKGLHKGDRFPEEEAMFISMSVLDFFGYSKKVIDNMLEPDNRDIFYMLEDMKILKSEREETTLHDSREWRVHYWVLNDDTILKLVKTQEEEDENTVDEDAKFYQNFFEDENIPEDIWMRS